MFRKQFVASKSAVNRNARFQRHRLVIHAPCHPNLHPRPHRINRRLNRSHRVRPTAAIPRAVARRFHINGFRIIRRVIRISIKSVYFRKVIKSIVIRIVTQRIRSITHHLRPIIQPVAITVHHQRIRRKQKQLFPITQPVPIRVSIIRISPEPIDFVVGPNAIFVLVPTAEFVCTDIYFLTLWSRDSIQIVIRHIVGSPSIHCR